MDVAQVDMAVTNDVHPSSGCKILKVKEGVVLADGSHMLA